MTNQLTERMFFSIIESNWKKMKEQIMKPTAARIRRTREIICHRFNFDAADFSSISVLNNDDGYNKSNDETG